MTSILLAASEPSLGSLLPRLAVSMIVVIGVMWLAARILKHRQFPGSDFLSSAIKRDATSSTDAGDGPVGRNTKGKAKKGSGGGNRRAPIVQVVGRQGVGKGASVTVVRAGDKTLVLGVTDRQITLLTQLDDDIDLDAGLAAQAEQHLAQPGTQWTGTPEDAEDDASGQARKGLLSQVREMTVRKS